jgi:hypothetical protein
MRKLMLASLLAIGLSLVWSIAYAGDCGHCGKGAYQADKTYVGWSGWHKASRGCGHRCAEPCHEMCKPKCGSCKPKCDMGCKPKCDMGCKPKCDMGCKQETCTPPPCEEPQKCCPAPVCEYPDACAAGTGEFDRNGLSRSNA